MYGVVRLYKMKSAGDIDKVVDATRSGFLPIVSKAPGYVAYTMAIAPDGELATVGFFTDRAGAEESTRLAAGWVRDNVAWSVEGPPKIAEGEVRIQEVRDGEATYGTMRRGKVQPGKMQEALELLRTKLVPLLSSAPGFVRVAFLESGTDEYLSLAAWTDRASAEEATRRAMALMQQQGDVIAGPPEMMDAEIKLHDVNEAALQQVLG
jgi:heme-degrading monooxygenase HmoA